MLDVLIPKLLVLVEMIKVYVLADPLRILYFFGSVAGIHYWYNAGRYNPSFTIRVIEERCDAQKGNTAINVKFQILNRGNVTVSLEPIILADFAVSRTDLHHFKFDLISSDQALPAKTNKAYTFTAKSDEFISLGGLRRYRIAFDRGAPREIFVRGLQSKQIRRLSYTVRRLLQR